jgi:hypothetical protein
MLLVLFAHATLKLRLAFFAAGKSDSSRASKYQTSTALRSLKVAKSFSTAFYSFSMK